MQRTVVLRTVIVDGVEGDVMWTASWNMRPVAGCRIDVDSLRAVIIEHACLIEAEPRYLNTTIKEVWERRTGASSQEYECEKHQSHARSRFLIATPSIISTSSPGLESNVLQFWYLLALEVWNSASKAQRSRCSRAIPKILRLQFIVMVFVPEAGEVMLVGRNFPSFFFLLSNTAANLTPTSWRSSPDYQLGYGQNMRTPRFSSCLTCCVHPQTEVAAIPLFLDLEINANVNPALVLTLLALQVVAWFQISVLVVAWDICFVLLRPHSMAGGVYEHIFAPYTKYG
jgi:hypothetical protein